MNAKLVLYVFAVLSRMALASDEVSDAENQRLKQRVEDFLKSVPEAEKSVDDLDLSMESTEELIDRLIRAEGQLFSPLHLKINSVLKERSDFRAIIEQRIVAPDLNVFGLLLGYPTMAGLVGKQFQTEIIIKAIHHPTAESLGYGIVQYLFPVLERSSVEDHSYLVDLMVERNVLKSDVEIMEWRTRLSSKSSAASGLGRSRRGNEALPMTGHSDSVDSRFTLKQQLEVSKWIQFGFGALVLLGLVLFFRFRAGRQ